MASGKKQVDLNALLGARNRQQKHGAGARPKEKQERKPKPPGQIQDSATATQEDDQLDQVIKEISQEENLNEVLKRQQKHSSRIGSSSAIQGSGQTDGATGISRQTDGATGISGQGQRYVASRFPPEEPDLDVEMKEVKRPRIVRPERNIILPEIPIKNFSEILNREKRISQAGGEPLSLFEAQCTIFLVDTSESMRGDNIETVKNLIKKFIIEGIRDIPPTTEGQGDQVQPQNLALAAFGSKQFCVLQHLTSDNEKILQALDRLEIGGCTPLCQGLGLALTCVERAPKEEMRKYSIAPRIVVMSDFLLSHDPNDLFDEERQRKELLPGTMTVAGGIGRYYEVFISSIPIGPHVNKHVCEEVCVHGRGENLSHESFFLWSRHGLHSRVSNQILHWPEDIERGNVPTVRKFAHDMGFGKYMGEDHHNDVNEKCILLMLARRLGERIRFYNPHEPNYRASDIQEEPKTWDLLPPFECDPEDSSDDEIEEEEEEVPDPGPPLPIMPLLGTHVVKGWDWMWRHTEIPDDSVGRVVKVVEEPAGWLLVKWNTGKESEVRYGVDGEFDVLPQDGREKAIRFNPGEEREIVEPDIPELPELQSPPPEAEGEGEGEGEAPEGKVGDAENQQLLMARLQEMLQQGQGQQQGLIQGQGANLLNFGGGGGLAEQDLYKNLLPQGLVQGEVGGPDKLGMAGGGEAVGVGVASGVGGAGAMGGAYGQDKAGLGVQAQAKDIPQLQEGGGEMSRNGAKAGAVTDSNPSMSTDSLSSVPTSLEAGASARVAAPRNDSPGPSRGVSASGGRVQPSQAGKSSSSSVNTSQCRQMQGPQLAAAEAFPWGQDGGPGLMSNLHNMSNDAVTQMYGTKDGDASDTRDFSDMSLSSNSSSSSASMSSSEAEFVPRGANQRPAMDDSGTYIWQWKDKRGKWNTHSKDAIVKLESAYRQNPRGTCLINQGDFWVRVMFPKMKQRDDKNHTESEVQRIEVDPDFLKDLEKAVL